MSEAINSTRKTTNNTCPIHAAVPAMPANPKRAAIKAIIRKVNAQLNIICPFDVGFWTQSERAPLLHLQRKRLTRGPLNDEFFRTTRDGLFFALNLQVFHENSFTRFSPQFLISGRHATSDKTKKIAKQARFCDSRAVVFERNRLQRLQIAMSRSFSIAFCNEKLAAESDDETSINRQI